MITPQIIWREYNPENGTLIGNVSAFSFARVTRGSHTRVKVVDVAFTGVTNVSNILLGLVGDAGITATSPIEGIVNSDGSVANGFFGVNNTSEFDAGIASAPLTQHFAGVNTTASPTDYTNVIIGNRAPNISNYIYLDIEVGSVGSGLVNGAYQIFFDFT